MKVMVCVKQVVDHKIKVRVKRDRTGVDISDAKRSINPFDEIALEEAVRLKEQGIVTDILAVSVCTASDADVLRTALAMGADRALHIEGPDALEPLVIAKTLVKVAEKEQPDLFLLGKQAIDDDCNQTGQMLAALSGIPQATNASQISINDTDITVIREIDGGLETLSLALPAVVTADLRLNVPRRISLPNMMKAKKMSVEKTTLEALGISAVSNLTVINIREPESRPPGIKVHDVDSLIYKLRHEAKVI